MVDGGKEFFGFSRGRESMRLVFEWDLTFSFDFSLDFIFKGWVFIYIRIVTLDIFFF